MHLRLLPSPPKVTKTDLLFALAFERVAPSPHAALAAAVKKARATGDLRTELRKTSLFRPGLRSGPARLGFIGMGSAKELTPERLRRAAAIAQHRAEALDLERFQLWIGEKDLGSIEPGTAALALAEGLLLGAYRYQPPSKRKAERRKGQRCELVYAGKRAKDFAAGLKLGIARAEGATLARDLGNRPANLCTPSDLAAEARKLADAKIKVKVLEERDMRRLKMGALLGVSRGSKQPAKLILLDHRPATAKRTVCVVGKGLTFDTGGISIKPSARMDEMRYDMCGGAAVLGLFCAIKAGALRGVKGKTRVVGVIASSENMPGPEAQKPGDVATACDGTTIEVLNTDAEGRLILADALAYAKKTYKPDKIIDLATLTGAVIVALGHEATGIMGNDEGLIEEIIEAGKESDEHFWQLPLWQEHREQMRSKFADLRNINGSAHGGGSIAGGAFLSFFVEGTKWAHLDIAGTAWGQKACNYHRSGATGAAVRTLVQWVRGLS